MAKRTTKSFGDYIRSQMESDPGLRESVDAARIDAEVASQIYELRHRFGLSQTALAERAGMHQSAIARLEDAEYTGHNLATLRRIAAAVGYEVSIVFSEVKRPAVSLSAIVGAGSLLGDYQPFATASTLTPVKPKFDLKFISAA